MNDRLKDAIQNLAIQSVNIKESKVFVRDEIDPQTMDRNQTLTQSFRGAAGLREISLTIANGQDLWDYRFFYSVGVRLIWTHELENSTAEKYQPLVEIAGIFEARYLSTKQIVKDELVAFSAEHVGYHVWPYWREYVQSSCSRIGYFPAILVPFYIIPPKEKTNDPT